ncbi:MAG: hypothetical protein ACREPW_12395, partial [Candidatus Binataceae bacterium]
MPVAITLQYPCTRAGTFGKPIALAQECENAARDFDPRITNSEGASVSTHRGLRVYGNSHGFIGGYESTSHSLSCSVIG